MEDQEGKIRRGRSRGDDQEGKIKSVRSGGEDQDLDQLGQQLNIVLMFVQTQVLLQTS